MNAVMRSSVLRAASMLVMMLAVSASVAAQTQVRVIRDSATIWRSDAAFALTTVKVGTVLDVVGRQGQRWFVVEVPRENGGDGNLGLIAVSQVEVISGAVAPPEPVSPAQRPARRPSDALAKRPRSAPASRPPVEVFGFGALGYGSWLAHDTFNAVLGSSQAPMFGGGLQVRVGSLIIEGSVERFQKTGNRVFVDGGTVYNLGIADRVQIIPITATVGYRHAGRHITPYVGGGVGTHLYKETSDFADPSENLSEKFTAYHVLGGVEIANRSLLRLALEMQYTTVPDAIGTTGASAAFNEHNLGGVHARVKIMVGR
jgi:opacity protein-like surface antigen